jgi:hypothetical protein
VTAKDAGDNSATQPTSPCSEFTTNRMTYAVDIPLFVTNSARSSVRSLPAKSSRLPRTNIAPSKNLEHFEQSALFQWANLALRAFPELSGMFAIPNAGKRSIGAAQWMKSEGLKAGVPDVCLPVARRGFHSLWIEFKMKGKRPTPEQDAWHEYLTQQGHRVAVCRDAQDAIRVVRWYLTEEA